MPPPIINLVETTVYADDLAAAEAFYGGVLGLPLIGREPGRHAFFQVGDAGMLLVFDSAANRLGKDLPSHGSTGQVILLSESAPTIWTGGGST